MTAETTDTGVPAAAQGPFSLVCDPGIDDMVALMVLVGAGRPPTRLVATAGNAELSVTVRNAEAICALLGLHGRVLRGCDAALTGPYPGWGTEFHGDDALGGVAGLLPSGPSASRAEPFRADALDNRILATSALTPVALALRGGRRPDVTWMGGACEVDGNMTAVAEFNAWLDPEAAEEVLRSESCSAMVPLDVTNRVTWSEQELEALGSHSGIVTAACCQLRKFGPVALPDVVAAAAFLWPGLFEWRRFHVTCATGAGPLRGMTDCTPSARGEVAVAVGLDVPGVKAAVAQSLRNLGEHSGHGT